MNLCLLMVLCVLLRPAKHRGARAVVIGRLGRLGEGELVYARGHVGAIAGSEARAGESAAVEVRGLAKRYGEIRAVDGIDLMVAQGEVYGFLGPNGAGKTTTLRMLLGLIRRDAGSVRLFGRDPADDALAALAGVAGIIEEPRLYPYLSGRDNLELSAALENIYRDCVAIKETQPAFDLQRLRERLLAIVSTFRTDLASSDGRSCLQAIEALSPSFLELERLEVPANYIVRLRTEQGAIRKAVLRVYHVQRTEFLPSAYILVTTLVGLIVGVAIFTDIGALDDSLPIVAFISFFFIYLVRLLRGLDTPFRLDERTMDDVSLFLLREFAQARRLSKGDPKVPRRRRHEPPDGARTTDGPGTPLEADVPASADGGARPRGAGAQDGRTKPTKLAPAAPWPAR